VLDARVGAAVMAHIRLTGDLVVAIAAHRLTDKRRTGAEDRERRTGNEQASCGNRDEA
jgi:hypothetical protein